MTATPIDLVADLGTADPAVAARWSSEPRGGRTSLGCASRATRTIWWRSRWRQPPPTDARASRLRLIKGCSGGAPRDHAFRRDRTVLRSRLSDGASEAQPARTRTAGRQTSPQAQRREPIVGVGDSVRTVVPQAAAHDRTYAQLTWRWGARPRALRRRCRPRAKQRRPSRTPQGPIDADRGARSFDTEQPGKANDNDTLRAASERNAPRA